MNMPPAATTRRTWIALGTGITVILVLLLFKGAIQRHMMLRVGLAEPSVAPELVEEIASLSGDPVDIYLQFWNTGKIPHRLAAMRAFNRGSATHTLGSVPMWLFDAARDPDLHVRELALGVLVEAGDPRVESVLQEWLEEPDPEMKDLALRQARISGLTHLAHTIAPLLGDPDINLRIATATTFRVWTDQDFGVRRTRLNGVFDPDTGTYAGEDAAKLRVLYDGLARWTAWWEDTGQSEFPDVAIGPAPGEAGVLMAPDFELLSLSGSRVRLSDLRGKPVLLNFWATWCTACWTEIPDLIELNDRMGDRIHLVGVSLDGLPDLHDVLHDHGDSEEEGHEHDLSHEELHRRVAEFAESKQMDYPILLDPEGITSELYVGNELPMNVIIDPEGHLYRRFMGTRSLEGFEAIITPLLED